METLVKRWSVRRAAPLLVATSHFLLFPPLWSLVIVFVVDTARGMRGPVEVVVVASPNAVADMMPLNGVCVPHLNGHTAAMRVLCVCVCV